MNKSTVEQFIKKAKEIHGNKYDYSKVNYINAKTKVCIICPIHGEFWQTPTNHLMGKGCRKCANELVKTKNAKKINTFLKLSKKIHGDKYDYSKVNYINAKTKVCIICPIHGEFWQTPDNHTNGGNGCPKCGSDASASKCRLSLEQFIEKAKEVHGDKYDYSKVDYINSNTKVCILCPTHGEFWQTPVNHLHGKGCNQCRKKDKPKKVEIDKTRIFIEKAHKIHGDRYDYSKVNYINSSTKVCIICPKHGEFWQTPANHLMGRGCRKCAGRDIDEKELISRFRLIHGDKYDYSKMKYIKSAEKVCIICPKHGEFWQSPNKHLQGRGCPICKQSNLEEEIALYLKNRNLRFEAQKHFNWLKMIGPQYLDFYLPQYNVAIECQGVQHFKAKDYYFGEENPQKALEVTISRDCFKSKICKEKGLTILYYISNRIKLKDVIDNSEYRSIYTKVNTFNEKKELFKSIEEIMY